MENFRSLSLAVTYYLDGLKTSSKALNYLIIPGVGLLWAWIECIASNTEGATMWLINSEGEKLKATKWVIFVKCLKVSCSPCCKGKITNGWEIFNEIYNVSLV